MYRLQLVCTEGLKYPIIKQESRIEAPLFVFYLLFFKNRVDKSHELWYNLDREFISKGDRIDEQNYRYFGYFRYIKYIKYIGQDQAVFYV